MGAEYAEGIPFSARERLDRGYCAVPHRGERWLFRDARPVLPTSQLRIPGRHNEANALAALALVDRVITDPSPAARARSLDALCEFPGLEHRCQRVAEEDGITFINDSKGTNVGATVAALRGLPGPLVLIAGGRAKGADFGALAEAAAGRLAGAVVIGEAGEALRRALSPVTSVIGADGMPSAVDRAAGLARASGFRAGDGAAVARLCEFRHVLRLQGTGRRLRRGGGGAPTMNAHVADDRFNVDPWLLTAATGLLVFGTIMVSSASIALR